MKYILNLQPKIKSYSAYYAESISDFVQLVVLRRIDLVLRQIGRTTQNRSRTSSNRRTTQNRSRTRQIDNRVLLAE